MKVIETSSVARFLICSAAFVIIVSGMKAAESLLIPFLLSIFIAVLCSPPLSWMHKKKVPYSVAIILIAAIVVAFGLIIGAVVSSSIHSFSQDLPIYQHKLQIQVVSVQEWLNGYGVDISSDLLREIFNPSIAMGFVGNALVSFGNVMTNAFMILLTVIFILAEESVFYSKLKMASSNSSNSLVAIERFTNSINRYMAIKSLLSIVTGLLITIWLIILDVDYPVLWGILAFLLNFVPTLGSMLAAIPAVLLALVQLGVGDAATVVIGYVVVNVVIGNIVEPRFMGKGLDLSALVVFLSLVFWGWVLGPVGMLLSVPLTMTIKIALESAGSTKGLSVMLGAGNRAN